MGMFKVLTKSECKESDRKIAELYRGFQSHCDY